MDSKDNKNQKEPSTEELKLKLRRKLAELIHHPAASKETSEELSKALESLVK